MYFVVRVYILFLSAEQIVYPFATSCLSASVTPLLVMRARALGKGNFQSIYLHRRYVIPRAILTIVTVVLQAFFLIVALCSKERKTHCVVLLLHLEHYYILLGISLYIMKIPYKKGIRFREKFMDFILFGFSAIYGIDLFIMHVNEEAYKPGSLRVQFFGFHLLRFAEIAGLVLLPAINSHSQLNTHVLGSFGFSRRAIVCNGYF